MKTIRFPVGVIVLLLAAALAPGCGSDDSPSEPVPPEPGNLPAIPVPASVNDLLPAVSNDRAVGLSNPIADFQPKVTELQMMQDDGTEPWIAVNRRLVLACPDVLPEYSCDPAVTDRSYISAPPRLLHLRYWRLIKQVTLAPGTTYEREETISYGTSTAHEESREFSQTVGVSVEVGGGWGPFSASVSASYEQTSTAGEVNSVSFSEESTTTETYSVGPDPDHTMVYGLWQLVDRFAMVDADSVRIDESDTMRHARLAAIADIEFPSSTVIRQSVTRF